MTGNIFINYRRDESGHVAGRLHDSLAPTFGRNKLFMDVDNIPVGRDFEEYLKSQVAACDAMLAVIGPNWLAAKDETGKRRLDNPDDFIVIEIGAALARNIPVVPVLVDGARMPKAGELPDSLKPLARRQAVEVRHANFSRDAEALVKRLREAIGYDSSGRQWRVRAAKVAAAMAVLFLVSWVGYRVIHPVRIYLEELVEETKSERERKAEVVKAEQERQEKAAAEAVVKAEQERQTKAAAETEAKRKAEQAEQQRIAEQMVKENSNRTQTGTSFSDLINRGIGESAGGDQDRAIVTFNEAIRLDAGSASGFGNRGLAYFKKGDNNQAIADFNEALRLSPQMAWVLCYRGIAKLKMNDVSGKADMTKARELKGTSPCN